MLFIQEHTTNHNSCQKRDTMIDLLQNPVFTIKDGVLFFAAT